MYELKKFATFFKYKKIFEKRGELVAVSTTADDPSNLRLQTSEAAIVSNSPRYPTNCDDAIGSSRKSGPMVIQIRPFIEKPFLVYCEHDTQGGGWTVFQRNSKDIDFYRRWNEYKNGFGDLEYDFWLGLDKIHALTTSSVQEMLLVLDDASGKRVYVKYDTFAIGDQDDGYALQLLGNYTGTTGDQLRYHRYQKFTTWDVVNHDTKDCFTSNCAVTMKGAWWFKCCTGSNLNSKDMTWNGSKVFSQMMIRPRRK